MHHHDNDVNKSCIALPAWLQVQKDSYLVETNHKDSVDNTNANTITNYVMLKYVLVNMNYQIQLLLVYNRQHEGTPITFNARQFVQAALFEV